MKKSRRNRTKELNAAAGLALRTAEKKDSPQKKAKSLRRKYQLALWRRERELETELAEAGIEPERKLDAYHARIALRGTTISEAGASE